MARLRATVLAEPACRYVFANGFTHFLGASPHSSPNCWTGRFNPPAVMQAVVLRVGMQFGPPSAAAYERTAFISLGGYATHLPIVADSLLFCSLAARFGVARISELLVHFKPTSDSYSTLSGWRRKYLNEAVTYWTFLSYYLWTDQGSFRIGWLLRRITSETKNYLFRH